MVTIVTLEVDILMAMVVEVAHATSEAAGVKDHLAKTTVELYSPMVVVILQAILVEVAVVC